MYLAVIRYYVKTLTIKFKKDSDITLCYNQGVRYLNECKSWRHNRTYKNR